MKNFKKLLLIIPFILSLCSCTETISWCDVKFNYEVLEATYYPIQTTYIHYDISNCPCSDYEHFKVKSFNEKKITRHEYKKMRRMRSEFLGLDVITTNGNKIFVSKEKIKFYVNEKCPYCEG